MKPFELLKLVQGRRRDSGTGEDWKYGILSDSTGSMNMSASPNVAGQSGKVWVRFPAGSDGGVQQYYPPVAIWEGIGAAFIKKGGRGVWVGLDPRGQPEVKQGDRQDLLQINITPAVTNPLNREGQNPNQANPFGGLVAEPVNTPNTPGWLVTVYPLWYDTGSAIKFYPGTGILADKVDLVSFKPDAGEYCYVMLWLDTDTNALETPTASTETVKISTLSNADKITAIEACYAAKPNANCIPIKAFYLDGDEVSLIQMVNHIDFRQMINMIGGSSSGAPDDATYITQTPSAGLTNEQALSALATGLMKSTTATGVVSIAVAETDYVTPSGAGTLANKILSQLHLLIGGFKGIFTHANSADRTYTLPNATGTVALTSDIPAAGITQLTGDVTAGPGSGSQVATIAAGAVTYTKLAEDATPFVCDYRLSCANVTDTLVDASGSEMFLAKWKGDRITLYDGRWNLITPTSTPSFNSQTSQAMTVSYTNGSANVTTSVAPDQNIFPVGMRVPSIPTGGAEAVITAWTGATSFTISPVANATGSVAALAVKWQEDKNYDFFAYLTGTSLDVELTCRAWTNNTTRAVALAETNGRWHMDSAPEYLYVGSGYNASGGSGMVDTVLKREIWSHFNQRRRVLSLVSGLNTFNDTVTSIHQYNSSTVQQVRVMIGLPNLSTVDLEIMAYGAIAGQRAGVGYDSTTTFDGVNLGQRSSASAFGTKWDKLMPDIGLHTLSFNVAAAASGQWFGVNNSFAAGMSGGIMA